jgi:predicted nuclease of restriction endonuclease-like (RecB) superfamily
MVLCINQNLSKRELQDKIKNKEYERLPETTKNKLINNDKNQIQDFIKDPIIIKNKHNYNKVSENVLQQLILEDIPSFLKELGDGFTFVENEYKIKLGDRYNYIDLLLFNYIYNHSFLGRSADVIRDSIQYHKDKKLISDTFYGPAFKKVIDNYLKTDIKKDWIGRLYGVVNPNINDGKYDFNNVVIEIDGDNTNNNEYVRQWVYRQMNLVGMLFKIEKLYDYIDISFEHVGPENQDNYLIIFDIVSRQVKAESVKKWWRHVLVMTPILAGIIYASFKFFI